MCAEHYSRIYFILDRKSSDRVTLSEDGFLGVSVPSMAMAPRREGRKTTEGCRESKRASLTRVKPEGRFARCAPRKRADTFGKS